MKNKLLILISLLVFTNLIKAECISAYKEKIKTIESRMNPPRTNLISNLVGEGALIGTFAAVTGAIPFAAVLTLPAGAIGAGAYHANLTIRRNNLRNAYNVIRDSYKGKGKALLRFIDLLNKRNKDFFNPEEIKSFILSHDQNNAFCEFNDSNDTYKLMTFSKLLRYTERSLGGNSIDDEEGEI